MPWGSWNLRWTESPDRLKKLLALCPRRNRVDMRTDALLRTPTHPEVADVRVLRFGWLRSKAPMLSRMPWYSRSGVPPAPAGPLAPSNVAVFPMPQTPSSPRSAGAPTFSCHRRAQTLFAPGLASNGVLAAVFGAAASCRGILPVSISALERWRINLLLSLRLLPHATIAPSLAARLAITLGQRTCRTCVRFCDADTVTKLAK